MPLISTAVDDLVTFIRGEITDLESAMASLPDQLMCSSRCPCDRSQAQDWLQLSNDQLRSFGRTNSRRDSQKDYIMMKFVDKTDSEGA